MKALPKPKSLPHKFHLHFSKSPLTIKIAEIGIAVAVGIGIWTWTLDMVTMLQQEIAHRKLENSKLAESMESVNQELTAIKNEDQYMRNNKLEADIKSIEKTYKDSVSAYEELLKLKESAKDTKKYDDLFSKILSLLSQRNYDEAAKQIAVLRRDIEAERAKIASSFVIPQNVPVNNAPPAGGYSRQSVKADIGEYLVDIISGDLGSTRAIVDTASSGDCRNDCPVLSLAEYVSRNGAYAGINGSYFCPASYPSCADKKNSFDTLLMNKNKVYFNSDNNVYSNVPAVIFMNGSIRWVGRSLEWGRDTGPDSVIANQPMLLSGGNNIFAGDDDPKRGIKSGRSFVASKGNTVYIGVVWNATVAEAAHVLKTLGLEYAINLDSGGSTALWYSGYKAGPGRNIPNAILLVRK